MVFISKSDRLLDEHEACLTPRRDLGAGRIRSGRGRGGRGSDFNRRSGDDRSSGGDRRSGGDRGGFRRGRLAVALDERVHGVGRLGALAEPVVHAGKVQLALIGPDLVGGLVGAEHLSGGAIAPRARLGDDHAIVRLVRSANFSETDFECHDRWLPGVLCLEKSRKAPGRGLGVKPHVSQEPVGPSPARLLTAKVAALEHRESVAAVDHVGAPLQRGSRNEGDACH